MFTLVHKMKDPGDEGDQISDPLFIRHMRIILGFLVLSWE